MSIYDKKIMPPLWLKYPEIEMYSIGWRMGGGEDYKDSFNEWFDGLTKKEQEEYKKLFPQPITWDGYWNEAEVEDESANLFAYGDFFVQFWHDEGKAKYNTTWLIEESKKNKKIEYNLFWGHQKPADGSITKSCFSQWWMSDFRATEEDYCCMEQYMMANKAELFGDIEIKEEILNCKAPQQIKKLGRKVKNFDEDVWNKVKYSIVLNGNYCKFIQAPLLRDFLLSTGDSILVEASPYDNIWGIKLSADSPDAKNVYKWKGENLLGFALMEVRDEIRRITANEYLCEKD